MRFNKLINWSKLISLRFEIMNNFMIDNQDPVKCHTDFKNPD